MRLGVCVVSLCGRWWVLLKRAGLGWGVTVLRYVRDSALRDGARAIVEQRPIKTRGGMRCPG